MCAAAGIPLMLKRVRAPFMLFLLASERIRGVRYAL